MRHYPDWIYHVAKVAAAAAMIAGCYYFWPRSVPGFPTDFVRYVAAFLWSLAGAIAAGFLTQCLLEGVYNTWRDAVEKKQRPDFWIAVFTGVAATAGVLTFLSQKQVI
jgi:hypothetical protein